MSKDIRSFFSVISKTPNSQSSKPATKKRAIIVDSSDEDVIPETPKPTPKKCLSKKRKTEALSSDSDLEFLPKKNTLTPAKPSKKHEKSPSTTPLKPVSVLDAFGSTPVKQSKVTVSTPKQSVEKHKQKKKLVENHGDEGFAQTLLQLDEEFADKKKKGKKLLVEDHEDEAFEQTLLQLDDEFLINNIDVLDRTVEGLDAIKSEKEVKNGGDKRPVETIEVASSSSKIDTPTRKRKTESQVHEAETDQDRYEKKRYSAMLYQKYLNRSGPAHRGSKELPKGNPDCLKHLTFLRTGVLDSIDKDEFDALIKEHGGRVVQSVSKKVNFVVVGEDAGPAKLEKAENLGIKTVSEDELFDLILKKSGKKPRYCKNDENEESNKKTEETIEKKEPKKIEKKDEKKVEKKKELDNLEMSPKKKSKPKESETGGKPKKVEDAPQKGKMGKTNSSDSGISSSSFYSKKDSFPKSFSSTSSSFKSSSSDASLKEEILADNNALAWTEKYKPTNMKGIIGQQGDQSNMKKLTNWLQNWHNNHCGQNRPKLARPSPWAKKDDGAYFKAALLSGPPGVGKTTTATLVSKELGFDVVEFNASDTRSKRLLSEEVSQLLSTKSLSSYFKDGSAPTSKHVLLMDEVDGMAGNEDRGGMQELIALIKNSSIPVICMCNDRNHAKVRSLANYCFDLRFSRPRIEQIRGAMMSVCFKEGIKITPDALVEVINGAGQDIRQTLNNLSMWSATNNNLTAETCKKDAKNSLKDVPLGAWEVCRKVFSAEEHKSMSFGEKSRLFYHDYSIGPLFVQENYLHVVPHAPKSEHLQRVADTADALSTSVLIEQQIRSNNSWSLLDVQAMFASVLPGHYMEGHVGGQINFPSWLGKNSKRGRFQRLLSELQAHMRTSISGSRSAVNLDYLSHLRSKIVLPLVTDGMGGVPKALEAMHDYSLLREDLDSILELALWPGHKDPMNMVESKIKAAFTRAYNKGSAKLPYAIQAAAIKKKTAATSAHNEQEGFYEDEELESDVEEKDTVDNDGMIKMKKAAAPKGGKKEKEPKAESSKQSKGKGGGRKSSK